jgi:hypothetical protein
MKDDREEPAAAFGLLPSAFCLPLAAFIVEF